MIKINHGWCLLSCFLAHIIKIQGLLNIYTLVFFFLKVFVSLVLAHLRNSLIEALIMMDCSSASCFKNSIRVETKNGMMDDDDDIRNGNSCVSDLSDVSSVVSSDDSDNNLFEEEEEEVNSNESSSSSPCTSSGSSPTADAAASPAGPLQDMSSLLQDLPFK